MRLYVNGLARGTLLATALVVLVCVANRIADAQPGAAAPPATADLARPVLRVATGEAAPFVLRHGEALSGFSIDLWNALAARIGAETRFVDLGWRSDTAQLDAVQRGEAEAAISAISMSPA